MKNGMYTSTAGIIRYYKNDKLHRSDGPALIQPTGEEAWFLFGLRHREDGPAIYSSDGKFKSYYVHGRCHRKDGPALIASNNKTLIYNDNRLCYLQGTNSNFLDGSEYWYQDNCLHREDGPAILTATKERYFLKGVKCTESEIKCIKLKMVTSL
jgi:hypothetical protein